MSRKALIDHCLYFWTIKGFIFLINRILKAEIILFLLLDNLSWNYKFFYQNFHGTLKKADEIVKKK